MMVAVHIGLLFGLVIWIWRKFPQPIFSLTLLLKVVAGISLGLLYQYYYTTGDTWTFFSDAKNAASMLRLNPTEWISFFWFDDWTQVGQPMITGGMNAMFMVKWVTFFNLITADNYWLAAVYLSVLSQLGAWILFKSIISCYPNVQVEAAIAIFFVPTIIFWSSGVIKECLALGALFLLSGIFIQWYKKSILSLIGIVGAIFSLWILWYLKYYWLAVWLATVLPLVVIKLLSISNTWIKSHTKFSWLVLFFMSVIGVSTLHPNFYYYRLFSVVVDNYNTYVNLSDSIDCIRYVGLEPTLFSMTKNAPWAVLSGFFRPFIWEANTIFQILAGVENFVLMILCSLALMRVKKWLSGLSELHLALFFYLVGLAAFLALSTPNFGSLSRYRIGFTPFLWLALLITSGAAKYLPKRVQNFLSKS